MAVMRAGGAPGRSFELLEPSTDVLTDVARPSDLGDAFVLIKRIDDGGDDARAVSARPASPRAPLALSLPLDSAPDAKSPEDDDVFRDASSGAACSSAPARHPAPRGMLGLSQARRAAHVAATPASPRRLAFVSPSHVLARPSGRAVAEPRRVSSAAADAEPGAAVPFGLSACAAAAVDGARRPRIRGSVVPSAIPEHLVRAARLRPAPRRSPAPPSASAAGGGCCSSGGVPVPNAPSALPSTAQPKKRCSGGCAKCRERRRAQEAARASPQEAPARSASAIARDAESTVPAALEATVELGDDDGFATSEIVSERFSLASDAAAVTSPPAPLSDRAAAFLCAPPAASATPGDAAATTQHWGVVVQARSAGAAAAEGCYLLRTSRGSPAGGVTATHFSLTRVARGKGLEAAFARGWLA